MTRVDPFEGLTPPEKLAAQRLALEELQDLSIELEDTARRSRVSARRPQEWC